MDNCTVVKMNEIGQHLSKCINLKSIQSEKRSYIKIKHGAINIKFKIL